MGTVLVWVGIGLIVVGAIVLVIPTKKPPALEDNRLPDIEKVLQQINALLEKFDSRLRPAVLIMVVGVTLVIIGVVLAPATPASTETPAAASVRFVA